MAESGARLLTRAEANRAYQARERMAARGRERARIADQAIRARGLSLNSMTEAAEIMSASDVYDGASALVPEERADGTADGHRRVVVEAPWRPSLVRRGERPRVRRAARAEAENGDLEAAIAALRASLKGRKGKSRILLKARIERLERARDIGRVERTGLPAIRRLPAPRPRIIRPIRQADYYGWTGLGDFHRDNPAPAPSAWTG